MSFTLIITLDSLQTPCNSLLVVWKCGQTWSFVFNMLLRRGRVHQNLYNHYMLLSNINIFLFSVTASAWGSSFYWNIPPASCHITGEKNFFLVFYILLQWRTNSSLFHNVFLMYSLYTCILYGQWNCVLLTQSVLLLAFQSIGTFVASRSLFRFPESIRKKQSFHCS